MTNSTFVLPMGHVQGVMCPVFNAPALLLKLQPFRLAELALRSGGNQPSLRQLAFGPDLTIHPSQLKRSGETQFLRFNRLGHNGSVFLAATSRAGLLHPRGESPPATFVGRF